MSLAKEAMLRGLIEQWRQDAARADAEASAAGDPSWRAVKQAIAIMERSAANQLQIVLESAL